MFIEDFLAGRVSFVEMEFGDLLGETALDVFDGEAASARVPRFDDVEEVRVGEFVKDAVVFGAEPGLEPVEVEVRCWVALDVEEGIF